MAEDLKGCSTDNCRLPECQCDALRAEVERLRAERDLLRGEIATAADCANTWARETGVQESLDPFVCLNLKNLIDRLWSESSLKIHSRTARERRYVEALEKYGSHSGDCILSQWSEGEPTPDGGYRNRYAGKWYQARPVDETPKCNCGFDEALSPAPGSQEAEHLVIDNNMFIREMALKEAAEIAEKEIDAEFPDDDLSSQARLIQRRILALLAKKDEGRVGEC